MSEYYFYFCITIIYRADLEALWMTIISDTVESLPMTPVFIKLVENAAAMEVRSCSISISDFRKFWYIHNMNC